MDAEKPKTDPSLAKRRYTGRTRLEAESGFKVDWPALSAHYALLTEAWDEDTHTLTVFLQPHATQPGAEQA